MVKHSNEEPNQASVPAENSEDNLEDTKPRRITQSGPTADQEPAPDEPIEFFDAGLDGTRPTPVGAELIADEPPPGFEQTIPPPPSFEREPASFSGELPEFGEATTAAPVSAAPAAPRRAAKKKSASKTRRGAFWRPLLIPVAGLVALLLIAVLSAMGGYASGIDLRKSAESTQMVQTVDQQFQLGLQDMLEGNYDYARQRFEYVIRYNPAFPGATEKLAEVLSYLNATATPTPAPEPTVTPTPDTRANEDLFAQGQQAFVDGNWDNAINSLLSLRGNDPSYRAIEIDGMLFLALRNRGKDKIVSANLESGIYDLTLAAKFAPLDSEAAGLLNWSQLYITGASFWEIDWEQVIAYFAEVAPQMPNLMDSSGMTASERFRQALFNYGNQLAAGGEYCKALPYYEQSLQMSPAPDVQAAYDQAVKGCEGGKGNETPNSGGGGGGKKKTPTAETPVEPPPPPVP